MFAAMPFQFQPWYEPVIGLPAIGYLYYLIARTILRRVDRLREHVRRYQASHPQWNVKMGFFVRAILLLLLAAMALSVWK